MTSGQCFPQIDRHAGQSLPSSCSVRTHTYESSLGWKLDSCLICKSAQNHVFLKEHEKNVHLFQFSASELLKELKDRQGKQRHDQFLWEFSRA